MCGTAGWDPTQPFHSGSSCHPPGPNFPEPMISAPIPGSWLLDEGVVDAAATAGAFHHRVANIHSCSLSPA